MIDLRIIHNRNYTRFGGVYTKRKYLYNGKKKAKKKMPNLPKQRIFFYKTHSHLPVMSFKKLNDDSLMTTFDTQSLI